MEIIYSMNNKNYSRIHTGLIKGLPEKTKEVFSRRFGFTGKERETLELIGQSFGITRERVRQIEEAGFSHIKAKSGEVLDRIFKDFLLYFKNKGGLKREDVILADLGGKNYQPYILFLLTLGEQFSRVCEKKDFYSFWTIMPEAEKKIKEILSSLVGDLQKEGNPLTKKEIYSRFSAKYSLKPEELFSYLEISKNIQENKEGKVGLIDWAEIKPRGAKDRAYLVFKKENKPLHFTKVAALIDKFGYNLPNKKTFPQTVHNELIKDPRFVLVGRGTYALKEWGYVPGTVKEVILQIMEEQKQPIERNKLIEQVLSQRLVEKNTVLMSLNDKKYFLKDSQGRYILRKTQIA